MYVVCATIMCFGIYTALFYMIFTRMQNSLLENEPSKPICNFKAVKLAGSFVGTSTTLPELLKRPTLVCTSKASVQWNWKLQPSCICRSLRGQSVGFYLYCFQRLRHCESICVPQLFQLVVSSMVQTYALLKRFLECIYQCTMFLAIHQRVDCWQLQTIRIFLDGLFANLAESILLS